MPLTPFYNLRALLSLIYLAVLLLAVSPSQAVERPWEQEKPDPKVLASLLDETTKQLDALPSGEKASASDNNRRAIMERRQGLLEALSRLFIQRTELEARLAPLETETAPSTEPNEEDAKEPVTPETGPEPEEAYTPEGLDQIKREVEQAHSRVAKLSGAYQSNRERLDQLPELDNQARERLNRARDDASAILKKAIPSGDEGELLVLQQENASMEQRIAELEVETLDLERRVLQAEGPGLSNRLDQEKQRLPPLEQQFSEYKDSLQEQQRLEAEELGKQAELKQLEAQRAQSPGARFLAEWEAKLSGVQRDSADLASFRTELSNQVLEQENALKKDEADLQELKGLIAAVGVSGPAADLLRELYSDIEKRRRHLQESLSLDISRQLRVISPQLVLIRRQLSTLGETWGSQLAGLPAETNADPGFKEQADSLQERYREALHSKSDLLRNTGREAHDLRSLPAKRLSVLDELEAFVVANVLWMQDARPLDHEVLANAGAELFSKTRPNSLTNWWQGFDSQGMLNQATQVIGHSAAGLIILLLVIVLPALLWWLTRGSGDPSRSLLQNIAGILAFPAYLLALGTLVQPGWKQFYSVLWTDRLLMYLAVILLIWRIARVFFHPGNGVAVSRFHMPRELAASLGRVLTLWAVAALLLLVPERLFLAPPFDFSGLPRLLYTAMEILVVATLIMLLRPRSALMTALFSEGTRALVGGSRHREQAHRFLGRHWEAISWFITAFLIGVVVLDVLGFRYTAHKLSLTIMATVVIASLLLAVYWILVATLDRFRWRHLRTGADAPSAAASVENDPQRLERQIKQGLSTLLYLGGFMLIVLAWSTGFGGTLPLRGIELYSVVAADGTREIVSLANLFDFIILVIVLGWLLRELKTLFELLLFPHLKMDRGKRYATVTISRYILFAVGVIIGLSILRVNLSNLGWLVAAMGVGLGFGLQEIFANFVSGLILLLERPIRVGDLVTIGNVMGNVTHISFRATTVMAFDNEEIVVPNKELITGQVTNWTLGSPVTRINIPIGVAYGTDVDMVSEILLELAYKDPEVLKIPAPAALFLAHGESSLDFELRVFLGNSGVRLSTRDRLNREINKAFARHGIEIPFPQRDVTIRSVNWPDAPAPVNDQP